MAGCYLSLFLRPRDSDFSRYPGVFGEVSCHEYSGVGNVSRFHAEYEVKKCRIRGIKFDFKVSGWFFGGC